MKRGGFYRLSLCLVAWMATAGGIELHARPKTQAHPVQFLVMPKPHVPPSQLDLLHQRNGVGVMRRFENLGGLQLLRSPQPQATQALLKQYLDSGLVEYVEPDQYWEASSVPNDLSFTKQWALQNLGQTSGKPGADIDAPEAWQQKSDASSVIVAVLDTGVNYQHEDLTMNMWKNPREIPGNHLDDDQNGYVDDIHGINAILRNGNPNDDHGHGTHVAGTIGAVGNNARGVAGVTWKVQIMALKFLASSGSGLTSDAITSIDYARTQGAHLINASWGGGGFSRALHDAISRARSAGILFVAAAGNEQNNNDLFPTYPAGYALDNVISVAASDSMDQFDYRYSNFGAQSVDLAAPGTSILSCGLVSNQYALMTGTSMAAPHVSGALALLRAQFPSDSHTRLVERMLDSVDPLPSLQGKCVSGGRLNLGKALALPTDPQFTESPSDLMILSANPVQVELSGTPGKEYQLQSTTNFVDWETVGTATIPESGAVVVEFPSEAPQEFYRMEEIQAP